jgi:predicted SprT family Zn-dependent metalloprotease
MRHSPADTRPAPHNLCERIMLYQQALEKTFQKFNLRFFNGRLSLWRLRLSRDLNGQGYCEPSSLSIHINPARCHSNDEFQVTILHEMAHAIADMSHGVRWRNEMRRLRQAGAPVPEQEYTAYVGHEDPMARIVVDA